MAKAASRGADTIILDLEASVAADRKEDARIALPKLVSELAGDVAVTVRINQLWMDAIVICSYALTLGTTGGYAVHPARVAVYRSGSPDTGRDPRRAEHAAAQRDCLLILLSFPPKVQQYHRGGWD
ncbi:MAG: aldolase/citrate lyase family protein [Pseudomonadota bacterium]